MQLIAEISTNDLSFETIMSTLLYTFLGIIIMVVSLAMINIIFKLNMHHELVEENNAAYGTMIAGVSIAIAVIIAGTILS